MHKLKLSICIVACSCTLLKVTQQTAGISQQPDRGGQGRVINTNAKLKLMLNTYLLKVGL